MNVLVTGANGFIGKALCRELVKNHHAVLPVLRRSDGLPGEVIIQDIARKSSWSSVFVDTPCMRGKSKVQVVVHLAAKVHANKNRFGNSLNEFLEVNFSGTVNLAEQAAAAGVQRFIYVSSVKVHGETTEPGQPLKEDYRLSPVGPYAVSKAEAENALMKISARTDMEIVIIRPPLVYGPGVKANFLALMRAIDRGVPLPFGKIENRRSLLALDNLVHLLITCIKHPAAANEIFLISDGRDLSTPELCHQIARSLGKKVRFFPLSRNFLKIGLILAGKADLEKRLCSSQQVDISKARSLLGWQPVVSVERAMREVGNWYLTNQV